MVYKGFACKLCPMKFKFACFLRNHFKTHKPRSERPSFTCPHESCGKELLEKKGLENHIRRQHGAPSRFPCNICKATSSSRSHLREHMDRVHGNGVKEFVCTYCKKEYFSKPELVLHVRTHTGEKPFQCEVCRKSFTGKSNLNRHTLAVHSDLRPYECRVMNCGKTFICSANRNAHEKLHSTLNESRPTCELCQKQYSTFDSLKSHVRLVHTREKPYSCFFCEYKCTFPQMLRLHTRIHTGEKPWPCDECGKQFTTSSHLRTHERNLHRADKPKLCIGTCSTCDENLFTREKLKAHKIEIHGEKDRRRSKDLRINKKPKPQFPCEKCGKVLTTKQKLLAHGETHKEKKDRIKPYACSNCPAAFYIKSNLKRHQTIVRKCKKLAAAATKKANP